MGSRSAPVSSSGLGRVIGECIAFEQDGPVGTPGFDIVNRPHERLVLAGCTVAEKHDSELSFEEAPIQEK